MVGTLNHAQSINQLFNSDYCVKLLTLLGISSHTLLLSVFYVHLSHELLNTLQYGSKFIFICKPVVIVV